MKQEQKLEVLRHSAAHLLAHAVSELFHNTKLTIGPATKTGFFTTVYQNVTLETKIYLL